MHVMFWDIKQRSSDQIYQGAIPGLNFAEILYADDTLLTLRDEEALETLVHEIEKESEYYGLRQNLGKCELLEMNGNQDIRFRSGAKMEKVDKAKYLGGILTKKADANTEIPARITATIPVVTSLDVLWKKANCSMNWKLLIFQAVIISKLFYG